MPSTISVQLAPGSEKIEPWATVIGVTHERVMEGAVVSITATVRLIDPVFPCASIFL